MSLEFNSKLLDFSRRIAAIAQSGLYYCRDRFDEDRYKQLQTIASEIVASASAAPCDQVLKLLSLEAGHATPKIDVRGACFDSGGQILLVKEMSDQCWSLPGGWAEVGLSPVQSIAKELSEEAGLEVAVNGIIGIFNEEIEGIKRQLFHEYKIIFSCIPIGTAAKTNAPDEILNTNYFPEDAIPALSETRTTLTQIKACFDNYKSAGSIQFFS